VRVNPAFERTLGWATEELEGKPYLGFVHPDDIAATMKEYANLLDGIPTRMFRNRYRCSDGSYIALLWNSQPDYDTGFVYAVARVTV
jgi:PAS domain S-box-containing protein